MNQSERLETALKKREQELSRLTGISDLLYVDWKAGDLTKEEHLRMKADYTGKIGQQQAAIGKIEEERQMMFKGVTAENSFFSEFQKYRNITKLNREILVDLVDVISVHWDGSIEIRLNFTDQYQRIAEFVENNRQAAAE